MIANRSKQRQHVTTSFSRDEVTARMRVVNETLRCPHCDTRLSKWQVPDSPFNEWPSEFQYICFNDDCTYFVKGWEAMAARGNFGSYRFMYDPPTGGCHPMAVLSEGALWDGMVVSDGC
jgi:hypothetical protein